MLLHSVPLLLLLHFVLLLLSRSVPLLLLLLLHSVLLLLLHCHLQGATNPVNSTASPPCRFNCTANRYGGLPVCFSW